MNFAEPDQLTLGQDSRKRKRPLLTLQRRVTLAGYAFLLPSIVGFFVFTAAPVLAVVGLSIVSWDGFTSAKLVGLANYERLLLHDSLFRKSLFNTIYYVVLTVPPLIIVGVVLALLVNRPLKGIGVFRTVYFMPIVGLLVAEALLWSWLFDADFGPINRVIRSLGFQPIPWLGSTRWAMPAVAIMSVWRSVGYYMVIFLAGLQAIPAELHEAARVDGANRRQNFAYVTVPLLTPVIFLALVIAIINTFQVFTSAWVLTKGGPNYSTTTIVMRIYSSAFEEFRMGYASAMAMVLFVIIVMMTLAQMRLQRRWVHYE